MWLGSLAHSLRHLNSELASVDGLEAEGIADADGVVGGGGRESEGAVKVELLMGRRLVWGAEADDVLGTAALGKGAGVFDVGVPESQDLAVEVDTGLAGEISAA